MSEPKYIRVEELEEFLKLGGGSIYDLPTYTPADIAAPIFAKLKDCRNELCRRCGQYREAHMGACDGCRWKEVPNE